MSHIASTAASTSSRRRVWVLVLLALVLSAALVGCGSQKGYFGTWYARVSAHDVELTINKNGTATYQDGTRDVYEGTWSRQGDSLMLSFDGKVSSKSEPLKAILSADGNTLTLTSDKPGWTADYYHRTKE